MDEAVVFNAANTLLQVLGSPVFKEIRQALGVKGEIKKLTRTVQTIQAVLLDAEKQHNKKNEEVTVWLGRLKDAFYDADDLLHDFTAKLMRKEMKTGIQMTKEVGIFFSKSNKIVYSLKIAHKIRAVRQKLEDIKTDRQFHLSHEHHDKKPIQNSERGQTHSFACGEMIIGRDDDKKAIIDLLLNSNPDENVSIIPIVGMGGLGKTTLVRYVYNDKEVEKLFPLRMWVCVSEEFTVKIIVEKIIKSITNEEPRRVDMDQLQKCFRKKIDGKRYLLVLDDLWNENQHKWRELKQLLMNGARGSKVLITTRSQRVANITNKHSSYVLQGLDKDKSWSLFKQIVFEHGIEPEDSRIVAIGKEIVAKCAGVPLALKTIGYLLYDKYKINDWFYFRDNELSKIPQTEDDILPILQLSYDYLLPHLKQCFTFCALFPKNYEIEKQKLIYLWKAQGFLQSNNNNQCLEDNGNNYFEDLLLRSFFQDPKCDKMGNIITCKMHDLMHDLAQSVVGIECTMITLDTKNIDDRCRHLSLYYGDNDHENVAKSWKFSNALFREKHVRTLLLLGHSHTGVNLDDWNEILSNNRHLRSLDFGMLKFKELPRSISGLRYLRYLNISQNPYILELPDFILRLRNLETLDLSGCCNLKELPANFRKLVMLRDLIIKGCKSLIGMPYGLGLMTNLQTLSQFVVQRRWKESHKRYAALEELNGLNNLRGKLKIKILGHMENGKLAELEKKQFLEFLDLEWEASDGGGVGRIHKAVLESLKPHQNLKGITIRSFMSSKISGWLSSLQYLNSITIGKCKRCRSIPPLEQLQFLKSLYLHNLNELKYVSGTASSDCSSIMSKPFFPSLEELKLFRCPKLKGWWKRDDDEDLPSFPCLSKLNISNCPNLTSMPLYPSLKELRLIDTSYKPLQQTMMLKTSSVDPSTSYNFSGPLSNLKTVKLLSIYDLESLPKEWMRNLTSLVVMEISTCHRLSQMSQGLRYLTSLRNMTLSNCSELELFNNENDDDMQWKSLRSLSHLRLDQLPKLKFLPKGLQYITALQYLEIYNCPNVVALLDWRSSSTSLSRLDFCGCPQLSERYANNKSVDWQKVSCIPNILIEYKWIQRRGRYLTEQCSSSFSDRV